MDFVITQTPVPPADPTAVFGRRILAWSIDLILLAVILVVVFANVATSQDAGSVSAAEAACEIVNSTENDYLCLALNDSVVLAENGDLGILTLIAFLFGLATHGILPALTGFSPGKAIVGLRIVNSETFARAGLGANLLRWLLWLVDGLPFMAPLVGLITGLASSGHRRVGDMAAKTIVIDKQWVDHPLAIPGVNSVAIIAPSPYGAVASPFGTHPAPPIGSAVGAVPPPPSGFGVAPSAPPAMPITPPTPPVSTPPPPAPQQPPPPITPPPPATFQPPPPSVPPTHQPPPPVPVPSAQPPTVPSSSVAPVATPPEPTPVSESAVSPDPSPVPADDNTTAIVADPTVALEPDPEPALPPPAPTAKPQPEAQAGVGTPQWDPARDTYIQYDPELSEWMEWSESGGAWVPISR